MGIAGAIAMSGGAGGGGVAGSAADAAGTSGGVSARVRQGKDSARKGKGDDAWRKMNLKKVKETSKGAIDCAVNSYGQVRDFFLRNPCKSLDRTLITLTDPAGNSFVVSVSWVRMRDKSDVGDLKTLIDTDGTGSVAPLMFSVLKSQGVRFTGNPFHSRKDRDVLIVAEGAVVSGKPDSALMEGTVEVAAELMPRK
ncbi:hypothetical protein [Actinokineospora sp. HUAS TT18]|uniref:hypothetical protein n=1 Tax=Actinokineospora sp. HUAS TT18 TaxID=3447451 RepID=UPI003F52305C